MSFRRGAGRMSPLTRLRNSFRCSHARGFSLLELLVALVIIGTSFTVLFSTVSTNLRSIRRVDNFEQRLLNAKSKLRELDLIQSFRPGDRSDGTFPDGTIWQIEVLPFLSPPPEIAPGTAPSMVKLVMTLNWEGQAGRQSWKVETYRLNPPGTGVRSLQEQLDALR